MKATAKQESPPVTLTVTLSSTDAKTLLRFIEARAKGRARAIELRARRGMRPSFYKPLDGIETADKFLAVVRDALKNPEST